MISKDVFHDVVMRANLAPSVHNVQPTRWRLSGDIISLFADPTVQLSVGDPTGRDAGLSCGAALEATMLALGEHGFGGEVEDLWTTGRGNTKGLRPVADIRLSEGIHDPLSVELEKRFTWRGKFAAKSVEPWPRDDTVFVNDPADIARIADLNDDASLDIMKGRAFRKELTSWMRLSEGHPRYAFDGLSREAMQMPRRDALLARWALGPLWPVLHLFGATKGMTAEAEATKTASLIACFHRPKGESPVASGRAYLRLCLEASALGLAGWPMAALSDHERSCAEMCERFGISGDRKLIQVLRFGAPMGAAPPRARRPLSEVLI